MSPIFIKGLVRSSKNSRVTSRKTGKSFPSKACRTYYKETSSDYKLYKDLFKAKLKGHKKPYRLVFQFVVDNLRSFDYINFAQTVQDRMTKFDWIDDDDYINIKPEYLPVIYGEEPGVYIDVLPDLMLSNKNLILNTINNLKSLNIKVKFMDEVIEFIESIKDTYNCGSITELSKYIFLTNKSKIKSIEKNRDKILKQLYLLYDNINKESKTWC